MAEIRKRIEGELKVEDLQIKSTSFRTDMSNDKTFVIEIGDDNRITFDNEETEFLIEAFKSHLEEMDEDFDDDDDFDGFYEGDDFDDDDDDEY